MGNSGRETRTALTDRDGDGDDKEDADGDDEGESGGRSVGITVPVRCFWSHLFYAGGAVSFPCLDAKAAESLMDTPGGDQSHFRLSCRREGDLITERDRRITDVVTHAGLYIHTPSRTHIRRTCTYTRV